MFKKLAVLSALALGTATASHATPISGYFSSYGQDSFTASSITFGSGSVEPSIGGDFATYLTMDNPITFLPGALPYLPGPNTPPLAVYPTGLVPIFSTTETTAAGTETFTFEMSAYNAGYIANNMSAFSGCNLGSTCLDITGSGFFTGSGALNGVSGPATFTYSSQYVAGGPTSGTTTFSASTSAAAPPVPEPSTLALLGTGMLGVVGLARRKYVA